MRQFTLDNHDSGPSSATPSQILPVSNATTPYWRTELHPIDQHRSTVELPTECDIAIIGAGFAGVSTAYHLSQIAGSERPSVVILEARQVCSGATGRNGGHVKIRTTSLQDATKRHGADTAEHLAAFVNDHIYAIKDVVEREEIDCEFELRRSFDVFLDAEEAHIAKEGFQEALKERRSWTRERNLVDGPNLEQVTSMNGVHLAFSVPICSLWPYKFVSQLLAKLIQNGSVNLQTNTPVMSITHEDDRNIIYTNRGEVRAKKVVFATNAYTAGICAKYRDIIIPTKSIATHITPTGGAVSPHLSHTYNIGYTPGPRHIDYLNPRPDGGIVVGGGNWIYAPRKELWYNNWDDSTLLPGLKSHFDGMMQRIFRGWHDSGAEVDHIWTGIQGTTPDQFPHIGEVPGSKGRQYVIAGFNGGGNAFILLSALGLAKMVLHGLLFEETGIPMVFKTTEERLKKD